MNQWLDEIKFDAHGLVPAIAQDVNTGRVLMVAWQNRDALLRTVALQQAVYYSRSRQKLWHKGEESGHFQQVKEIRLDCDGDVIILQIEQQGGIACHTGRQSCFYRRLTPEGWQIVDPTLKDPKNIYIQHHIEPTDLSDDQVEQLLEQTDILDHLGQLMQKRKQAHADQSYVANLYQKGLNKILEKIGEESIETIIAAKEFDQSLSDAKPLNLNLQSDLIYEIADLWFHTIIALGYFDLQPQQILDELARRQGLSGLVEKANRQA